jgi:hypothetical protein
LKDALQRNSSGDASAPLRAALVEAMGATRDPGMLETYRAIVDRRSEPVLVRAAALRALGQVPAGGRVSPADAIKGSLTDRDDAIRLEAVRAMRTTADIIYAEYIFDRIKPDSEPNPAIREEAWGVLRNLFDQADPPVLMQWADRAVIRQNLEHRIEIYKAVVKKFIASASDNNLALARQTIGNDLMALSDASAQSGDVDLARARAKEADLYLKPALDYYAPRQPHNQTMITGALIEKRMDALLASADYSAAADFAATQIDQNPANREALGAKLRNEVDRLRGANRASDALALIDAIGKMRAPLAPRDMDFIHGMEQNLRGPRSANGSELRDAVGSGQ